MSSGHDQGRHPGVTADQIFGGQTREPYHLALRAYVWGYPLVEAARIRMAITDTDGTSRCSPVSTMAPLNNWGHSRLPADPSRRVGVGPSVDLLYSSARLDLADGPFVFRAPDFGGRYYTFQMAFADTSAEVSLGQRTHGGQLPVLLIRGPGDSTPAPPRALIVDSPTRYFSILGRILFRPEDPDDLGTVRSLQDRLRLDPLGGVPASESGRTERRPRRPPGGVSGRQAPSLQFLEELGDVLRDWVIWPEEHQLVSSFAEIGLTAEHGFQPSRLSPAISEQVLRGLIHGETLVREKSLNLGTNRRGWTINYKGARFGRDYLLRAGVARDQIYVTVPEEALYPVARVDATGEPLDGARGYRLRFEADDLPPVAGFWSVTLYDDDGFLVANPLNRYSVSDRIPGLMLGDEGGLDILIQADQVADGPGKLWLPACKGPFYLMMRLYVPRAPALDGSWSPPAIVRLPLTVARAT